MCNELRNYVFEVSSGDRNNKCFDRFYRKNEKRKRERSKQKKKMRFCGQILQNRINSFFLCISQFDFVSNKIKLLFFIFLFKWCTKKKKKNTLPNIC